MTQNNMNSHVLVRVGAEFRVANMESFRIQIPANVTKQHEFTVFGDDRKTTTCTLLLMRCAHVMKTQWNQSVLVELVVPGGMLVALLVPRV